MYVKIIDKGECFSTTREFINGVYANRAEWAKHNFYPRNEMVGELVKRTPSAYIIKIKDGIYVPMTAKGIKEITYEEYVAGLPNNVCTGMDKRQQHINNSLDEFNIRTMFNWQGLPDLRIYFKNDIIKNIERLTCDYSRKIFLPDLEESAIMYTLDLCLEYQDKSGRKIDPMTIQDIANQVGDVYMEFFSDDFLQISKNRCSEKVMQIFKLDKDAETMQKFVDKYYQKINERYSWS